MGRKSKVDYFMAYAGCRGISEGTILRKLEQFTGKEVDFLKLTRLNLLLTMDRVG